MLLPTFLFINLLRITLTEREHKVHNIILYPENSWCRTTPIQQVVSSAGYESVTIDNNVCVGACFSYSIPSTQPAEPGELIRPYCDSCQPSETECYHVTLHADSNNVDGPRTFQKLVQIIKNCSCMSCEKVQQDGCDLATQNNTQELPRDLFSHRTPETSRTNCSCMSCDNVQQEGCEMTTQKDTVELQQDLLSHRTQETKTEDVPELLRLPPPKKHPPPLLHYFEQKQKYQLNSKLINLLKSIQNEEDDEDNNISYDKEQLGELLKIIEGSDSELSDKNLMEFVNYVNTHNLQSEDLELDSTKLKEVLTNFKKSQKDLGLELGQKNNADIERDLKKYNLPPNFGIEGIAASQDGGQDGGSVTEEVPKRHHLGEEVHVGLNLAHLVKGPHGSMVLAPNLKVEEKLNIDSDHLKLNEDGLVLSYENHHDVKRHKNPNVVQD